MTPRESDIYIFNEFRVDVGKGVLTRAGQPLSLQWKTFETLCHLVESEGRLVTREELMDKLWADTFVEDNNLSQHIRALRKVLGDGQNGDRYIETVPRRGYRFLPDVQKATEEIPVFRNSDDISRSRRRNVLVGRDLQLKEIREIILRDETRILTLTGVGGTGKTTIARAIAEMVSDKFDDGVYFVEMGAITDPDLVAPAIIQSLEIKETGESVLETLRSYLKDRRILLIVDNFEQLLSAGTTLAEISRSSQNLKILVTSRAVLRLSCSIEYLVPPLELPSRISGITADEASRSEAVSLFVKRAKDIEPSFELTADNASGVAQICSRLDGIPLAIELAAARVAIISPAAILERMANRLDLLTGGANDLPARQQTVRNTLEWSYELLSQRERTLFRRLAVFSGGFTMSAAEAVALFSRANDSDHRNGQPALTSIDVLNGVTSLAGNSLLVRKEQSTGKEPRFGMLEVVREFAIEALEASGEADIVRRSHAEYFLGLAETADPLLHRGESVKWLNRLEEEHDNLRSVLQWALTREAGIAARMAAALRFFWLYHTHIAEGSKWVQLTYEQCSDAPANVRSKLLNALGVGARIMGNYKAALEMHQTALAASTESGDKREIALSSRGIGAVSTRTGDFELAQEAYQRTLKISRELNDTSEIGYSLGSLGGLARLKGDLAEAQRLLGESLETFRELGLAERVITNLLGLGTIALCNGEHTRARLLFEEAIVMARELSDKIHISDLLDSFASLSCRNETNTAAILTGAAEHIRESIDYELAPAERKTRDDLLAQIQKALGEPKFSELAETGRQMSVEEAVDLALQTSVDHPDVHA
jgi:predicted ATPase